MNELDVTFRTEPDWISFGQTYVGSESFRTLFRDGMNLVEESAAYLDGEGRDEGRLVSHEATLAYAGESMRLTTRLMQIASWLLVQRAVSEGEISLGQALEEKRRVRLTATDRIAANADAGTLLPTRLLALIERSHRLHARILHLDTLVSEEGPRACARPSPVALQHGLLASAFAER